MATKQHQLESFDKATKATKKCLSKMKKLADKYGYTLKQDGRKRVGTDSWVSIAELENPNEYYTSFHIAVGEFVPKGKVEIQIRYKDNVKLSGGKALRGGRSTEKKVTFQTMERQIGEYLELFEKMLAHNSQISYKEAKKINEGLKADWKHESDNGDHTYTAELKEGVYATVYSWGDARLEKEGKKTEEFSFTYGSLQMMQELEKKVGLL